ncbi:MAG: isochorismatase [Tepidisphaeraceae bacterium]
MAPAFAVDEPFAPRPIRFLGLIQHAGWRLKSYSITLRDQALVRANFDAGLALALRDLPAQAVAEHRPGVGFVILHQGRGSDYIVLCWWDSENELPHRTWVRPRENSGAPWRLTGAGQAICVWDLQIIWFERETYVKHVLGATGVNLDAYLEAIMPDAK